MRSEIQFNLKVRGGAGLYVYPDHVVGIAQNGTESIFKPRKISDTESAVDVVEIFETFLKFTTRNKIYNLYYL